MKNRIVRKARPGTLAPETRVALVFQETPRLMNAISIQTALLAAALLVAAPTQAAPASLNLNLAALVTVKGESGKTYALQAAQAPDATEWDTLDTAQVDAEGSFEFLDRASRSANRFYRVVEMDVIDVGAAWNGDLNRPFTVYRMTEDLARSGNGLRITASHLVLDLNGHRLAGDGAGTGIQAEGVSGVFIHGGQVTNFTAGVSLDRATNTHLKSLSVFGLGLAVNNNGILATNSTMLRVEACQVFLADTAIRFEAVTRSEIHRCTIQDSNIGARLRSGSTLNRVHDNIARNNLASSGIRLETGSHRNEVYANLCTGNQTGIFLDTADENVIRQNTSNENGWGGIWVRRGTGNVVQDNVTSRNGTLDFVKFGILLGLPQPFGGPHFATGTLVEGNTALDNQGDDPFKIDLFDNSLFDKAPPLCENTWRGNTFVVDNESGADKGPGAGCIQ